ncbi:MAG: type III-A CRISPR-associated RAMP protein Csm4, partial [Microcoleaceae cyanobacterium]
MGEWKLIRLNFGRNPVHFGELGIGIEETSERVRSDSLFSAWVSAYARLFGKEAVEEMLGNFINQTEPPFRLSSTLIYRQVEGKTIYYLPRPLQRPTNYPKDDFDFAKEYKKLNYLPLEVWQRWYQGEGWQETDKAELRARVKKLKIESQALENSGTFGYSEAFEKEKLPKIAVDRTTRATNIYQTGFVKYSSKKNGNDIKILAGLYFLVYFSEPDLLNGFLTVLNFLGEEGLGGERSGGAGQFQVDEKLELTPEWKNLIDFTDGNYHSLISLFWQPQLSIDYLEEASYELHSRGGWTAGSPTG